MEPIDGNMLRGHLEAILLSVLERGAAHGFEVMKRLEEKGCGALSLKEGTVYPILYRLEHSGFVRAAWDADTTTSRGPRRRVYHVTSRGRRELARRRKQWDQFVCAVGPLIQAPQ